MAITGFTEQTCELSEKEIRLIPAFVKHLSSKIGQQNAISNKEIRQLAMNAGIKIPDSRVRKIINHIRRNGLVKYLCSNSDGYYVAQTDQELLDYIKSLEERISAIAAVKNALKDQHCGKNSNQKTLFNQ